MKEFYLMRIHEKPHFFYPPSGFLIIFFIISFGNKYFFQIFSCFFAKMTTIPNFTNQSTPDLHLNYSNSNSARPTVSLYLQLLELFLPRLDLLLLPRHRQQRLHLGVQLPPGPVPQRQILLDVPLQDALGHDLLDHLLVLPLHLVEAHVGLQHANDARDRNVSHVLQLAEHARLEEDLCWAGKI